MPAVELLAAIVESSDDAIIAMTLDGTIVSWNRTAEGLYGFTGPEAVGEPLTLIVPDDRRGELDEIMSAIRAGNGSRISTPCACTATATVSMCR